MQLDENGKVLFSNSDLFARDQILDLALDEDGSFSGGFGDYYLVAKRSDMGFIYVNGVPQEEYLKEMIVWYEKIFLLCVFTAIPALLIMLATRNMLGRPIKSLEQAIEEVGEGKLEPVSEDLEVREFRELMHKINEMKVDIKNLLTKVQTEEEERQKTEREKLMYQINPHFLLNTLNSVQWMAQLEHQESISRFLADFKSLLAYNLGKEEKSSTLRTEVEIAQKYINLQRQRYDFEATMEVEEGEYLETETIRMLLQPLIENALRYGLGDMGVVDIRIFQDERKDCAVITIQDHGSGLSREKLEQLNRPFCYKGNGEGDIAGIGLRYVRHCLEGFYKGESILTINSEIGRGTKVTIIIPVRIAKEHT
nr:histidine kinase [uncultured Acetatifactor sp.]